MKLYRSTESKVIIDANAENMSRLEITEVVLAHCNIDNKFYHQGVTVLYTFFPN